MLSIPKISQKGNFPSVSCAILLKRAEGLRTRGRLSLIQDLKLQYYKFNLVTRSLTLFLIGQVWKLPPGHETPKYILVSDEEPTISLEELMNLMKDSNAKFTLKERRTLAVILSHAMLHICESSWLKKELRKENISFLLTAPATADLRRPYLSAKFPKDTIGEDSVKEEDAWASIHPSLSLLGLGVILIELEHGPIENMRQEDDLLDGKEYSDTNRIAAQRCLENKRLWDQNPYPAFQKAVSACIDGMFLIDINPDDATEDTDTSHENLELQLAIYNNVTRYLEEELRTIDRKVASDTLSDVDFDLCFECPSSSAVHAIRSFVPAMSCLPSPAPFRSHVQPPFGPKSHHVYPNRSDSRVFDSKILTVLEDSEVNEKSVHSLI